MFEYKIDISRESHSHDNVSPSMTYQLPLFVSGYGYYEAGSQHFVRASKIPYGQLLYTISGAGKIINETTGNSASLTAGTAVFMYGGNDTLRYYTDSDAPWVMKWLRIEGTGIVGYTSILGRNPVAPQIKNPEAFQQGIDQIAESIRRDSPSARAREAALVATLLSDLIDSIAHSETSITSPPSNEIGQIVWEIQLNPEQRYSVKELAQRAGINQYGFIRQFKAAVGQTPYQYIIRMRTKKAIALMQHGELSLEAIAEACGFYDLPTFTHTFTRLTGMTPSEFRKSGKPVYTLFAQNGDGIPWL